MRAGQPSRVPRSSMLSSMATFLLLLPLLLAACDNTSAQTPDLDATPTPGPTAQNLTYIGGDGNIWQLSLPHGSATAMTTDASKTTIYSGLAWSPDGTRLAAIRETLAGSNTIAQLLVLADDGSRELLTPLPAIPYAHKLIWSPNNHSIAYRVVPASTPTKATLHLLFATTGAQLHVFSFPFQQECATPTTPLRNAIAIAHASLAGIDTFDWSSDGRAILVSAECSGSSALRIDATHGYITPDYPADARFQPKGRFILGSWRTSFGTLSFGVSDASGAPIRSFVSAPLNAVTGYLVTIGAGIWDATGQQVYYEYDDSIWRIGADGRGARILQRGTALDTRHHATVELTPLPSPNGQMLAYLQIDGIDQPHGEATSQWYVVLPGIAQPALLPDVVGDAVWQPDICYCSAL